MWVWVAETKKAMCTYMSRVLQHRPMSCPNANPAFGLSRKWIAWETEAREKSQVKTKSWELRHIAWHVVSGLNKTLAAETMLPLTPALDKGYLDQSKRSHQSTVLSVPVASLWTLSHMY